MTEFTKKIFVEHAIRGEALTDFLTDEQIGILSPGSTDYYEQLLAEYGHFHGAIHAAPPEANMDTKTLQEDTPKEPELSQAELAKLEEEIDEAMGVSNGITVPQYRGY